MGALLAAADGPPVFLFFACAAFQQSLSVLPGNELEIFDPRRNGSDNKRGLFQHYRPILKRDLNSTPRERLKKLARWGLTFDGLGNGP